MTQPTTFTNYTLEIKNENDSFEIPIIEMQGEPSSATLFIFAALHGDEYEATRAIHQVQDFFKNEPLIGKVIAIPVANPAAFKANSRTTPEVIDGGNLARSFPGDSNGTLTQKIANTIWNFILDKKTEQSYILDLHSGGQHYSYVHLSGVRDLLLDSPQTKISKDLARAMQMPNLWFMPATVGTLSTVAIEAGMPAIGCEVEGTGGLNDSDVLVYFNGILNVLRYTNQLKSGEMILQEGEFLPIETVLSPSDGFIASMPKLNSQIEEGDSICEVLDYFGNPLTKVLSPCSGKIWAVRRNPSITEGEIVSLISRERTAI